MLIYICDDSKSDSLRLMHHLSAYENEIGADFSTVAFSSGDEMFSYLKKHREIPDLFFLDIYMEGKDGMEVARELRRQQVTSGIIFTTSSTEHAMDSYEVHALYYLQKPFTHEHFLMAMQRCEALIQTAQKKLSVSVKGKELLIAFSDILYLETGRHTVIFHTRKETFSVPGSLSRFADAFADTKNFLSCGRSYLVNLDFVEGFLNQDLIMSDNSLIPVPIRKQSETARIVEEYKNSLAKPTVTF